MSAHSETIPDPMADDTGSLPGEHDTAGDALPEVVSSATLVVIEGPSRGRIYRLVRPLTTVGRARGVDVVIPSRAVSLHHAQIELSNGRHTLTDLGSRNGTSHNGKTLSANAPVVLQEGDTLSFADFSLIYLKANDTDAQEMTQALQRVTSQPSTLAPALQSLDIAALAQLLQLGADPAQQPEGNIDDLIEKLLAAVRVAKRYSLLVFVMMALAAVGGVASMAVLPPLAEASCILALRPEAADNPASRNDNAERAARAQQTAQFFSASEQDFVSEGLIGSTLSQLLGRPATADEMKVASKRLQFDSVAPSTYRALFKNRDAGNAVSFLTAHLKNFLETEIKKQLQVTQAQVDFLTGQIRDNEAELQRTEQTLRDFKQRNLEGLPEYTQGHMTTREELYGRQSTVRAQLDRSNLELAEARRRLAEMRFIPETTDREAEPYKQALVDVNRRLSDAKARGLGDEHPEVVALNDQAKRLQGLVAQAQTRKLSGVELDANRGLTEQQHRVADLQVASKASEAELGEIGGQLARLNDLAKKMPDVEAKYAELSRSYEVGKNLQTQLYERLRSSQVQLAFNRAQAAAQFEVSVPPRSYGVPIRRTLFLRAAIGSAIGFAIALLIALGREVRKFLLDLPKRSAQRLSAQAQQHPALPRRPG